MLIYVYTYTHTQRETDSFGKRLKFSRKWCWENWTAHGNQWSWSEQILTPYTKIYSKWLKYWNIRHDTMKLLEEHIGKRFCDTNHTKCFSRLVSQSNRNKSKVKKKKQLTNKWAPIKHTSFCTAMLCCHFSRVRLCATPQMAAHQAPPSLAFSRQEHWSGLPFPSPMHESDKWKWRHSVVTDS